MEFSKKKYLKIEKRISNNGLLFNEIYGWGFVKFQNIHISESIEFNEETYCVLESNFDEFKQFCFGKKSLLVEKKTNIIKQKSATIEGNIYSLINIKIEKIFMSNGNFYQVLC